jgi:hypothetical protein
MLTNLFRWIDIIYFSFDLDLDGSDGGRRQKKLKIYFYFVGGGDFECVLKTMLYLSYLSLLIYE